MKSEIWLNRTLLDIVFEGRNKSYGAFDLRQRYERNMAKAMFISMTFFVIAWIGFSVWLNRDSIRAVIDDPGIIVETFPVLTPVTTTVKPPAPAPQPKPASTALVTPTVVREDEVPVETEIPTQEELTTTVVGNTNEAGSGDENAIGTEVSGPGDEEIAAVAVVAEPDKPFNFYEVDQMPIFPGGEKAMYEYLQKNLKYPSLARESNLSGTVMVRFVVNQHGEVEQVEILRSPSPLFNAEALRVIQHMPDWKPASRKGKAVSTFYMLPLKFQLL